jgi:hypothetical protein
MRPPLRRPAIPFLLAALAAPLLPCTSYGQTSAVQSVIDANVPAQAAFDALLQRDLTAYFRATGSPTATAVEWTLLRQQPTQSGISYPKYYAWVRVLDGRKTIAQGALRFAAAERTHFEVRNFVSAAEANTDPERVSWWFPAPLVDGILARAQGVE